MDSSEPLIRIGELSRRLGVSVDRLRAWERRYQLLQPMRTAGGFRLYSRADELRGRAMQDQLAAGLSAAEAARATLTTDASAPADADATGADLHRDLGEALTQFDAIRAHALIDRLLAEHGADDAIRDIILPLLHDLGERWARGEVDVSQEHFASRLLEARLLALLRGPDHGAGPIALLACAPGELHTLGLVAFGIALRNRGWRITYLGADTPIASIRRAADHVNPALVVLSAAMPTHFAPIETDLRDLSATVRLAVAGAGTNRLLADRSNAEFLDADPVTAAESVTRRPQRNPLTPRTRSSPRPRR
jgi:MerR family transcriptional regulator, light-induced transcriptional regulator